MNAEMAVHTSTLAEAQEYSISLAKSDLLPVAYRGKPANVLLAVESGKALGIPAIQAINQIHIINGTPALSANLMRALVQRAGHIIRVEGDDQTATATLIRKDDSDYQHTATWTLARAKVAGLTGGNWAKHPAAMLKARATAEVCRNGAADVLMGFDYIEDEVRSFTSTPVTAIRPGAKLRAAAGLPAQPDDEIHDADVIDAQMDPEPELPLAPPLDAKQMRHIQALFGELGITESASKRAYVAGIGVPVESMKDLTSDQAEEVIASLESERRDA